MPYDKVKDHPDCPTSKPIGVVKESDGELMGCHTTEEGADDQIAALYAQEEERMQEPHAIITMQDNLVEAFSTLIDKISRFLELFTPKESASDCPSPENTDATDRAIALGQIYSQVDSALYQMDSWPWLLDLYVEEGEMFAVAASGGKLYRFAVNLEGSSVTIGEGEEVETIFQPTNPETPRQRTMVFRDADTGAWRWLSISCTAVLNRVGEIDSRALFDSIVENAEETGEYPFRTFYHCGEALKYGQCDYLARDGYCLITSGLFDTEGENADLALAEIEARQKDPDLWGESIGYLPTAAPTLVPVAEGIQVLAYDQGVGREISCVLEAEAAALFTQSTTQEVSRMRDKVKAALKKLGLEDSKVEEFEEKVDATNRSVEDQDLIAREAEEPTPEEEAPTDPPEEELEAAPEPEEGDEEEEELEPVELEIGEEVLDQIAQRATAGLAEGLTPAIDTLRDSLDQLTAAMTDFGERIEALEQTDEEKREQWLEDLPRSAPVRLSYRPREAHEADTEEETLPGSAPKDYAAQAQSVIEQIPAGY